QCKKQAIVANSTTKVEYVAAANCCGQVLWIQNQMMDYGFNFMNTKIHIDNESTISVIKNPVAHSRTKHIEIRFHFIRDCYEKRLIEVIKIHTDNNVADLLTKGFDVTGFNFLVYSDKHNMVAFLKKPNESVGFTEVVDFLKDSTEYTITEASVKSKLQLADATGIHNLSDAKIYAGLATLGISMDLRMDRSSPGKYNSSMVYKHNMVAFLKKPNESVGFTEVVDFLKGTSLSKLQLADATGIHNLSDAKIYAGLATLGYVTEGAIVPLLPAMLAGAAVDQVEGSAQPAEPHHTPVDPISSTSQPPHPSPLPQSPPHSPLQSPPHSPLQSPPHSPPQSPPHLSPPRSYEAPLPKGNTSGSAKDSIQLKELMVLIPKLVNRIGSLEKELKETKQTLRNAVLKLVKKDIDDDPLVSLVRESMKEKSTDFVTPTKASREAQEEEISPTILRRASLWLKRLLLDWMLRKRLILAEKRLILVLKKLVLTGSTKIDSGTASKRSQREGKALMIEEDIQATYKSS
ncbi:hypothetical protein Tco_1170420, partial [Tanacetum coccineum]